MTGPTSIGPAPGFAGRAPHAPDPGSWRRAADGAGPGSAGQDSPADMPGPVMGFLQTPSGSTVSAAAGLLPRLLEWAGARAPVLARGAAGGVAAGILLTPTNAQRQVTEVGVAGQPGLGARWERAPGSVSGTVTLYPRGPDGQQAGPGLTLDMDAQGRLTGKAGTPQAGVSFGTLPLGTVTGSEGVRLDPDAVATLAGPGQGPAQQLGIGYGTRTQEESDLAASLQAQGKSGAEIAAALDELRRNNGAIGTETTAGAVRPGGHPPGKLTGSLEQLTNDEKSFVVELLADGHDVEVIPTGRSRTPDFKVDGTLTELKTMSGVVDQTSDGLSKALASRTMDGRGQATTIIVNARDQPGMTLEIAQRGIARAVGADNAKGSKIQSIIVLTQAGPVTFRRQ